MPISLRVQAVADEASFDRTAERAEKRFGAAGQESGKAFAKGLDDAIAKADPKAVDKWTSAYDRLRDATGKVRVEQAKLDDLRTRGASEARLVAQAEALERARRAEVRATKSATDAYNDLSASGNRLLGTLSSLSAGTRLGGVIGDAEALAGRFGGVGLAVGGATVAVAGLAIGIGAAGSKLYELGAMWDDVADGITARTGKMGADLDAVMSQVTRVADQSAASIADIGTIAAQVSGSIGATGDDLGDLSAYIADLNDVTGQQTNIRQLGMLYNVFKVQSADQISVLNELYTAYTKTQIPVNDLIATLVDAGPVAQEFKLTLGQTSGLLASFAAAGIKGDSAVKGLRQAMTTFAKAGQEPTQALTQTIDKIRELSEAGRDKEARDLAFNVFGKKAYVDFLNAIESGKVSTRQLSQAIEGNTSDIREVRAATDDARQEFDRLTNKLETRLKPVSEAVFGVINDALSSIIDQIDAITSRDFSSWWEDFNRPLGGPWGGGGGGADSPWLGGGVDNLGGPTVRGTPGRGFPMPWKLDGSGPANMHGSHGQIGVLAQMAETKGLSFASGADNHPQDSGFHPSGQAGDFSNQRAMGPNTPEMNAFAEGMLQYAPFIRELIYSGASHNIYKGKLVPAIDQPGSPYNTAQAGYHGDHVHIAIEDGMAAAFEAAVKTGGSVPRIPSITRPGIGSSVTSIAPTTSAVAPLGAASSTPGYDDQGNPGYYASDPKGIRSAQERIGDIQDNITKADQRIADVKKSIGDANDRILEAQQAQLEAIQKAAEIQADTTATEDQKRSAERQVKSANDAVTRATEARDRIVNRDLPDAQDARDRLQNRDLRDANEALADAQRGTFTSARSGSSRSAGGWGAPIANDFGLSGGLPGLAENLTNLLGNMAFAPAFGALSAVSAAGDPTGAYQGAGGLIGMMAAGSGIGGPLGGGPTTVGGIAPTAGTGGAGFGGIGGLPMAGLQAAAASLDAIAPGASIAANMGIQLANRSIAQIGKDVGIGVGGLMETFAMPGADPGQSWFGRIAAGLAGAKPALPNMAGGSAAAPNNGQAHGTGNGAAPGPGVTVNYTNNQATEDRAGKDLTNHLTAMYAGPGR